MRRSQADSKGFVLLTVVVLLAILASVVMMLASSTNTDVRADAQLSEGAALSYAAESGIQHAMWTLHQGGCSDYTNVGDTVLGDVSYRATVSPNTGSPVSILSESLLSGESARQAMKENVLVYDQTDLRELTLNSEAQIKDSYLEGESGHTTHNKATDKSISVSSESDKVERGLIEFDLSELPVGVRIESAVLTLELSKFKVKQVIEVYRVTQSWTEAGVTWESRDGSADWAVQGGDYDDRQVGSLSVESEGLKTLDLTNLVASWAAGSLENHGILLLAAESERGAVNEFTSSEADSGSPPELIITYSCECGAVCTGASGGSAGPVAHWRFDDGFGLKAIDSEGGHDGLLENGPKWTASGQLDGALQFDGLNDQVSVPHSEDLSLTEALTITAWIKVSGGPVSLGHRILSKETPGLNDNYWLSTQADRLWLGIGGEMFLEGQSLSDNVWYHVAATYDALAGEVRFYVDGVESTVQSTTAVISANEETLLIGSNWEQSKTWRGDLDDVRIYNRALSLEEIVDVMSTEAKGGAGTVVESYRDEFNERDYEGNDGRLKWSTDWLEIGENDGPNAGDERVRSDDLNEYAIRVRDNDNGGEGVQREFDLSGCLSSTFSFDYRRAGFDNVSDYVTASVSANGGSSWTELTRFSGPADDGFYGHYVTDVSAYIASDSRIRFLSSSDLGAGDILWIDNIDVTCE
ncbi:MAG: LamG-like jellyroll fold domain-containing protein [Gammaproteobacteria bacterium]